MAAGDAYHWIHTRSRCSASYTRGGKGGGGGGGQCYIFYYLYTHTHTYIRIYIYAYLLLYLYVCPRSTPILYRIAHTFIAYTHFAHILDCARHARHNPYVGHARHQLCSDYARTGNQITNVVCSSTMGCISTNMFLPRYDLKIMFFVERLPWS